VYTALPHGDDKNADINTANYHNVRHQRKKKELHGTCFHFSKTAGYTCYSLILEILRPGKKTHILAGDRILGLFASKNPHLPLH
jgi:hypothetical protein